MSVSVWMSVQRNTNILLTSSASFCCILPLCLSLGLEQWRHAATFRSNWRSFTQQLVWGAAVMLAAWEHGEHAAGGNWLVWDAPLPHKPCTEQHVDTVSVPRLFVFKWSSFQSPFTLHWTLCSSSQTLRGTASAWGDGSLSLLEITRTTSRSNRFMTGKAGLWLKLTKLSSVG